MEKLLYTLWRPAAAGEVEFRDVLCGTAAKRLAELGARGLVVNVVDEQVRFAEGVHMDGVQPRLAAVVSFWLELDDARPACERPLADVADRIAGYAVAESVALRNETHRAAPGERTPGVNVVAFLRRPDWIEREAWLARWLDDHRRVALETQCTYAYIRNVVVRALTPEAPPWAAIVEEGFPSEAVTDAARWYRAENDPAALQRNVSRMVESCRTFLDLDRVERHPMSEYRFEA